MHLQTYSQWRETCNALHMVAQMMGKVKLECLEPQPEWGHVLLEPVPDGFSTGFVPHGAGGFEIRLRLDEPQVQAVATTGEEASFPLEDGTSVARYYERFTLLLEAIGHPVPLYPVPQEMFTQTPFYALTEPLAFDGGAAWNYFEQCLFAQGALLDFSAGFRGKKMQPSLFWGTLDLTCVLFSGKPCPYAGEGGIVERVALDEQFVEFGFWPGDEKADDPAFFVMAYPFLEGVMPEVDVPGAYYDPSSAEYFLKLEDVLRADDPHAAVARFCHDAFVNIAANQRWERFDWLTRPLLV